MKTCLLAIAGLTPQVITETLYALHQEGMKVDEIRILTTRLGKDACIGQLLRAEDGEYYRFLDEYGINRDTIDFGPRHIKSVLYEDGTEIDDIDTEEENELFLSLCMREAFSLTSDPERRVFFSIAGGRKTMGACLSLAAQCYARPQDRIYHVLLSPGEFESCRDFFYPPIEPRLIDVRNRQGHPCKMETSSAQITLVPMPFFPLRERLSEQMLRQAESPATLMLSLVREKKHELIINLVKRTLTWKGKEIDMSAACLALYVLLAQAKKDGNCTRGTCQECESCYLTFEQISKRQKELTKIYQTMTTREIANKGIAEIEMYDFNSYKSKINRKITLGFGKHEAYKLQIESFGDRPSTRYGIRLDKGRIRIVN